MARQGKHTAQEDTYGEALTEGDSIEYNCDGGCGTVLEVSPGCLSIAGGDIYCPSCGGW